MGPTTTPWRPLAKAMAVLFVVGVLGLTACGDVLRRKADRGASPGAAPIVAATVNGKPIYISDVEAEATVRGLIREGEEFDSTSDEFYQILEDLIETRLFAMEAETRQLDRNADVRHRLERARELILAGALNDQIRDSALDEAAVERMYREQARLRRSGREVHLRHALFATKEAAQTAKRRLDSGVSTFAEVAYDSSIDRVSGSEGGDLGFRQPDDLPDTVREAAAATQVGQIAGPFQTTEGWNLLKVEERREEAPPSMESLRPRIETWLMFEEQRRLVEKLKQQARIERIIEENAGVAARDTPAPASAAAARRADARKRDAAQAPMGPGGIAGAAGPTETPTVGGAVAAPPPAAVRKRPSGQPPSIPATPSPVPEESPLLPAPEPKAGERET